jgi:uncharacterized surface protein with fasciclin (FAS1) repeats
MNYFKQTVLASIALLATYAPAQAAEKNIIDLASETSEFSTLVAALQAADLVDVVRGGTFTVFAPTNEAFEKLPEGTVQNLLKPENKDELVNILTYHVIGGSGYELSELLERNTWSTAAKQDLAIAFKDGRVRVNDATLQTSDIRCENGTVHIIDSVLIPPTREPQNIVETAAAAGSFNTLLAAAKAADLVDALSGSGPFTVFAPTDAAFAKVPEKTLNNLLKPENKDQLVTLLKYHVVAGTVRAGDALNAGTAKTLNNATLPISYKNGELRAQWAKVLEVDIAAGNGIIHVIDSVLLPPGKKSACHTTDSSPIAVIAAAITQGVPMYNRGDAEGCAAVYMATSKALLDDCAVPKKAKMTLHHALSSAANSHCVKTQAWALREGLDYTYAALKHAMSK